MNNHSHFVYFISAENLSVFAKNKLSLHVVVQRFQVLKIFFHAIIHIVDFKLYKTPKKSLSFCHESSPHLLYNFCLQMSPIRPVHRLKMASVCHYSLNWRRRFVLLSHRFFQYATLNSLTRDFMKQKLKLAVNVWEGLDNLDLLIKLDIVRKVEQHVVVSHFHAVQFNFRLPLRVQKISRLFVAWRSSHVRNAGHRSKPQKFHFNSFSHLKRITKRWDHTFTS